ncbi:hypothetical protein JMJ77_0008809 [Colletotrichum scovillei]|uniref:Uncharacterized protein n=1 Tax=Colletotrichum scovillei TaxID=1209932 RepID=A0A9P7QQS3_9PEZI|nr:hypothetical protein JMJ78_0001665 [Colletotrichum scovillei]KAG7041104.1 hypothetical protein JMJ77_0008809 [Colletotrichum scovillei]KAG7061137.1 hypothetical protein JMJ76_0010207 [Colletotrichum scovillei]
MANRCIHQIRNLGFSTTCVANEGLLQDVSVD